MPPSLMAPLITIEHLNHYFGKNNLRKQILHDINLAIDPGEIVIMTGPSGSGKTTLLTLIGALRSVQEGSLCVLDQELRGASNQTLVEIRRTIGYIFQAHNLLPFMTARQNVRMSLALGQQTDSRYALKKVDEVLTAVGLGEHLDHHPDKLSGGQKQRVAIARALVNEPALLLADEPTASLDSATGRDVVELMYSLAKNQQCTILLVTHDHRILDVADRIVHLEDGKLQQDAKLQKTVVASTVHAPQNGQAVQRLAFAETFDSPDASIASGTVAWLHTNAESIADIPNGQTESVETEIPSFVPQESNHDPEPEWKLAETKTIETEPTKTELADLARVESTIVQWHDPLPAANLDSFADLDHIERVIQEDFQTYVDQFTERKTAAPELIETELIETEPIETKTADLTVVEATMVQWHNPSSASNLDYFADLDHIERVTQEDFQTYVEWFSFRATDGLSPTEIYTIACIDDSPAILETLSSFLSDELFSVVLISDPIKALTELLKVKPNLIILDITMPRLNGYQLCELLRRHQYFKDLPIIFITGDQRLFNLKAAQKIGVQDCLIKPFDQSDLIVKLFPYLVQGA